MSGSKTEFRCHQCGSASPRWSGRCPGCSAWNSLIEERAPSRSDRRSTVVGRADVVRAVPVPIGEVDLVQGRNRSTGTGELDRVLGGGLVAGSVTLVGGEPGAGKSTLLLQVLASLASGGQRCLLVSAEESAAQVRSRAERLGALVPGLMVLAETEMGAITTAVHDLAPDYLVVDSIQTVLDESLESAPGTVGQVRECAHQLVRLTKARSMSTLLVGHVTKEGTLAGPRVLEHVVDTVLSFEGDRHHALRMLRAVKHRFGPTTELGLFEMTEAGLQGVPDAGALFLSDRQPGVAGSVVVPIIEGHRPLLVELQALVVSSRLPVPRRSAQGVDGGRLALMLAVLERRVGMKIMGHADVFASAVGGVRVTEPGADLALALALASAACGVGLPPDMVACAEVGLGGELRQVAHIAHRLAEAYRLGFNRAIVSDSAPDPPEGMAVVRARSLSEAVGAMGLIPPEFDAGTGPTQVQSVAVEQAEQVIDRSFLRPPSRAVPRNRRP